MMTYKIRYRRFLFWRSLEVLGHRYEPGMDKLVVFRPDGSVEEIPRWSRCALRLGLDWKEAIRKQMEKEAGQPVVVGV
jgi:hypothetical protein